MYIDTWSKDDELQNLSQEQRDRFLVQTLFTVTQLFVCQLGLTWQDRLSSKRGPNGSPRDHCRRRPPSSPVQALAKQRDIASGKRGSQNLLWGILWQKSLGGSDKCDKSKSSNTTEERSWLAKENRCFCCGEQGHKSKNRPNSSRIREVASRRQLRHTQN